MVKIKYNNGEIFFPVKFRRINENVVYIIGDLPINNTGFIAYNDDEETILGDYSDYRTVYREMGDGIQYSNNGSIWVEPTHTLDFFVIWEDDEHAATERPSKVLVTLKNQSNEEEIEVEIKKSDNWIYTLNNVPASQTYMIVSGEEVENYEYSIPDISNIVYYYTAPTWSDKIESQVFYTAMETDTLLED